MGQQDPVQCQPGWWRRLGRAAVRRRPTECRPPGSVLWDPSRVWRLSYACLGCCATERRKLLPLLMGALAVLLMVLVRVLLLLL